MEQGKNSDRYVVVIDQDKIEPELARETVINYDPLNRAGKEGGFYIDENEELHIDEEDVMEAHKMAINKYPYEGAIKMIQLPAEEGEKVHQFHDNSFRLYGLPAPDEGSVVGIIGENGTGKSVALKILAGDIKPNLGDWENPPEWEEIQERYRGTDLQNHFKKLAEEDVEAAFKPQKVEDIPKAYTGKVRELLEGVAERKNVEEVAEQLDIEKLLDREVDVLSGGELQRVAIASTVLKEADIYMIDEPSSFLDVKQRLNMGEEIRKLGEEKPVLAVEHDLATLDLISDRINIFFGDPGNYGMVSNALSSKDGVNRYLEGYLPSDNIRIRSDEIKFDRTKRSQVENKPVVAEFPKFTKDFGEGEFKLETEPGKIHDEEIMAIFGENGLGKTVFAKMLAGAIESDEGDSPDISISYKPQYLDTSDAKVEDAISEVANPNGRKFETRIAEPLELEPLYEQKLSELSGGELQRVGVAICLAKDADLYLLDEPSAYLDVESRVELGKTLKRFARKTEKPLMVIDHDLLLLDYIADRGMVFKGEPGEEGVSTEPKKIGEAMNEFLKEVEITFRKDPETGRPRANKPDSQKDQSQRSKDEYYEQ
ncbi:ribosome biogenesis/translation initiation ATPase RLI [Candidatus Nanohalobium constans]|uniref:Ribosome biogenesis/translation initiation ATPase RLI n=1 Tax=Candidatus Nanohalobium constans TaxID=2565781 RepID=A0A5Q0UFI9_9ARCH|nr:ribosome biogenesis/translation initiation ATPase RLI [Candidatus Nanohalobium constans]QGA80294.1 ribosome biogenesis/translation initiation ATPase RLI [Candidatus Nanohalobium constans]